MSYIGGGSGNYYLFKKQGGTLTIQKGDSTGVNGTSPTVATGPVGIDHLFTVGAGQGCPSVTNPDYNLTGFVQVRDFVLEADMIVPFPPNTASPPSQWVSLPTPTPIPGLTAWGLGGLTLVLAAVLLWMVAHRRRLPSH